MELRNAPLEVSPLEQPRASGAAPPPGEHATAHRRCRDMMDSVRDRPEQHSGHLAQGSAGGGHPTAPVAYRGTPSAGNPTNVQTGGERLAPSTPALEAG
eukprot:5929464-Prymnesium_polylepis.1